MKRFGICLFEDQLIRNYLISDNGRFLKLLINHFEVYIFTNFDLKPILCHQIEKLGIDESLIHLVPIGNHVERRRLSAFLLRWMNRSSTTLVKIKRMTIWDQFPRLFVYKYLSKSKLLVRALRFLYSKSVFHSISSETGFTTLPNLDILFSTSLTNYTQELDLNTWYKNHGVFMLGTVRSWDNLTSHGLLRVIPDIFLCHSPFIRACAIDYQFIDQRLLHDWCSPSHQQEYLIEGTRRQSQSKDDGLNVLYASMGTITNPDDYHFTLWLIQTWSTARPKDSLTIMLHPKSPIDIRDCLNSEENIKFCTLDYVKSTQMELNRLLQEQDLVICGGTTIALDAHFCNVPIALVNFEIVQQPYWHSALRYYDAIFHTASFVKTCNLYTVKSLKELLDLAEELPMDRASSGDTFAGFFSQSLSGAFKPLLKKLV